MYLWKAFCSVLHRRLIAKSSAHGILGKVATWLPELLGDRLQKVVLSQAMSEWTPVASGIPKESVLGPLLFLFHENDFPDLVQSNFKMIS